MEVDTLLAQIIAYDISNKKKNWKSPHATHWQVNQTIL